MASLMISISDFLVMAAAVGILLGWVSRKIHDNKGFSAVRAGVNFLTSVSTLFVYGQDGSIWTLLLSVLVFGVCLLDFNRAISKRISSLGA